MSEPNEARIRGLGREQASEEPEVEGHRRKFYANPTDEPAEARASATDEPETEGHRWVNIKATDQPQPGDEPEVEGRGVRSGRAVPGTDEPNEGYRKGREQASEESETEVEGFRLRGGTAAVPDEHEGPDEGRNH